MIYLKFLDTPFGSPIVFFLIIQKINKTELRVKMNQCAKPKKGSIDKVFGLMNGER